MFDIVVIIPPKPIKRSIYKCDKIFHIDYVLELSKTFDSYVIAFISGKITEFHLQSPNETKFVRRIQVDLPNQHKTGGSSAARFGRIRDEKIGAYIKHIVDEMVRLFCPNGVFDYVGLIVAGCGEIKDRVVLEDKFKSFFSKHLIQILTIPEITSQSINETFKSTLAIMTVQDKTESDLIATQIEADLNNPTQIDFYVFGEADVIEYMDRQLLDEVYVGPTYADLIKPYATDKTVVHLMSKSFEQTYGLMGRKYYANLTLSETED